jgi:hypothetical protein
MEEMTTTENYWRNRSVSVEPHFNDERSIRSAQPVVPLETVTRERWRRGLILGGAFVIACLLGSTAALALIRLRQPAVVVDTTAEEQTDESKQAAQTAEPETPPVETASDSEPLAGLSEADLADLKPSKPKKKGHKHSAEEAQVQITVRTNPATSDNGQARMVGQWEERRQRRVSRDRPPLQNHHSDDLFRIREIFEGPRRSRRINNN